MSNAMTRNEGELTIVPFDPQYGRAFFELNKAWLDRYFLIEPYDIEVLENPEKMVIEPGGEVYFGLLQGKPVATFALTPRAEGVLELNKMAVREDLRSLGMGHQLLEFLIDLCRRRGIRMIELYSHTRLESALHLYRKFGFEEVPVPEDCVYDRADIRMQRAL
jgi:GNAT superfamily N-acetyltransferase